MCAWGARQEALRHVLTYVTFIRVSQCQCSCPLLVLARVSDTRVETGGSDAGNAEGWSSEFDVCRLWFRMLLTTFVNVIKCNWLRLCALPLLRCTLDLIYLLWVSGCACLSLKVDGVINCSRTPIILINQSAVDSYLHSFCVYTCPCIYITHTKDIIHWNMDRLFLQFMLKASS